MCTLEMRSMYVEIVYFVGCDCLYCYDKLKQLECLVIIIMDGLYCKVYSLEVCR